MYESLGIKLTNYVKASSYVANSRIIRDFRDANFSFKNYRVLDLASTELVKSDEANDSLNSWKIISDTCVTKDCDISVKRHLVSFVAKKVRPFFGVVEPKDKDKDKKNISVTYKETAYNCVIVIDRLKGKKTFSFSHIFQSDKTTCCLSEKCK